MKIYSAVSTPQPVLPRWLKPLEWWLTFSTRLAHATAGSLWSVQTLLLRVAVAYSRDFTDTTVRGWAVAGILCASVAMRFIAAVDYLHFSLSLWHDCPLRKPAFRAAAQAEELAELLGPGGRANAYQIAYASLVAIVSLVLMIVAAPYWLITQPVKNDVFPASRLVRLARSIVATALVYGLMYVVMPALILAAIPAK